MHRVEYIRIELHNPAFFITSSMAFVIEKVFQPSEKGVAMKNFNYFNFKYSQLVTHQQSQLFL